MSCAFRTQALRRLQRIMTQDHLRHRRSLRRRFQEDFELLRDDIKTMSQSLKNVVELLKKFVEGAKSSVQLRNVLSLAKGAVGGMNISPRMCEFRKFAFPILSLSELVYKIHLYHKRKEIWNEAIRNMEKYNELADLISIRNLLDTFAVLNKYSLTRNQKRVFSKKSDLSNLEDESPFPVEMLSSFSERVYQSVFQQESQESTSMKKFICSTIGYVAIPQFIGFISESGRINLQKNEISEQTLNLEAKIKMLDDLIEFGEKML